MSRGISRQASVATSDYRPPLLQTFITFWKLTFVVISADDSSRITSSFFCFLAGTSSKSIPLRFTSIIQRIYAIVFASLALRLTNSTSPFGTNHFGVNRFITVQISYRSNLWLLRPVALSGESLEIEGKPFSSFSFMLCRCIVEINAK